MEIYNADMGFGVSRLRVIMWCVFTHTNKATLDTIDMKYYSTDLPAAVRTMLTTF